MKTKKIAFGLLLFFSLTMLTMGCQPQSVMAQAMDLSLSPPLTIKKADQGALIRYPIQITNTAPQKIRVKPHIYRFTSDGKTGSPQINLGSTVSYARIETEGFAFESPFSLEKGQTQTLVIAVTPPSPLREDLQMVFLLEADDGTTLPQSGASITGMIGSNLILQADEFYAGKAPLQIKSLTGTQIVNMFSPITIAALIENTGSTVASISGVIQLTGMRGETKETIAIFPDLVLGKSTRLLRMSNRTDELNIPMPPQFTGNFWPGIYKVTITLRHPQLLQVAAQTTASLAVIIFPSTLLFGLLGFVAFFAIARFIFKHIKH